MRLTVGQLRGLLREEAEALGPRDVVVHSVDDFTGEVTSWVGNIERIRVGLLNAGIGREDRNAILADEKYIEPDMAKALRRAGIVKLHRDPADVPAAAAPAAPGEPKAPRAPSKAKETYKIYPGGGRYGAPAVARVKKQLYKSGPNTRFKGGEVATMTPDGVKMRVKKTDGSGHEQTWDPSDG